MGWSLTSSLQAATFCNIVIRHGHEASQKTKAECYFVIGKYHAEEGVSETFGDFRKAAAFHPGQYDSRIVSILCKIAVEKAFKHRNFAKPWVEASYNYTGGAQAMHDAFYKAIMFYIEVGHPGGAANMAYVLKAIGTNPADRDKLIAYGNQYYDTSIMEDSYKVAMQLDSSITPLTREAGKRLAKWARLLRYK
ncbi:MAG: hypothetical protein GY705_29950 [Bacteroidetes bacterium]|nr:hypothetical protein [Bacteroidota bacterium]